MKKSSVYLKRPAGWMSELETIGQKILQILVRHAHLFGRSEGSLE